MKPSESTPSKKSRSSRTINSGGDPMRNKPVSAQSKEEPADGDPATARTTGDRGRDGGPGTGDGGRVEGWKAEALERGCVGTRMRLNAEAFARRNV